MESPEESEIEQKSKKEKPKNILDCKIACVVKRSRFKPRIKRVRMNPLNVFPLELPEYQRQNYIKKLTCPKCMGNMEITVRREKAGLLYYKLILGLFVLIFIVANALVLQNGNASSNTNTLLEVNALIVGSAIVLLILVLVNNYLKTRTKRMIRLKIKTESKMSHKLHKVTIREYKKKPIKT